MKLVVAILFTCLMQVSASSLAQRITLSEKNVSLELLLKKIKQQTGYDVLYGDQVLSNDKKISVKLYNATIPEALDMILEDQNLSYTVGDNTIVIKEKTPSFLDKIIDRFQEIDVRGKVVDQDGKPLVGATVKVKGTNNSMTTNSYGEFGFADVYENAILIVRYIGYKTQELKAVSDLGVIKMELGQSELEEVQISGGYYITTDKLKTGSIIKVTAKDIERQPVTNPLMALQGRVPGLEITPNTGAAGGSLNILIRGRNSLRANASNETANGPLIIIDGVPIDGTPLQSGANTQTSNTIPYGYDPLSTLNPSNIESIEVLKDADATAIYGSRGANGVILITSKKGYQTEKTNFDLNLYSGVGQVANKMELLNTQEYLLVRNEAFANDKATPEMYEYDANGVWGDRYTDWQKELLGGSANIHDIQAGLSGGNGNTSFKFDGTYHEENVIYSGDFGFQRLSGSLTINHISSNKKLHASANVSYGFTKNKLFESTGFVTQALTLVPNGPSVYDVNGKLNWEVLDLGFFKTNLFDNPLAKLKNTNDSETGNLISNGLISYMILPGLSVKANMGITRLNGNELLKFPIEAIAPTSIFPSTRARNIAGFNNRSTWIVEPQITYLKKVKDHSFNVLVGASWQGSDGNYQSTAGDDYVSDALLNNLLAAGSTRLISDDNNRYKYMAYFMRIGYDWKGKYLLSLTGRRDGSSRFSPDKQFGDFGAIGAAWIFSQEKPIKEHLRFLSFGKLRASYGLTGNDQIGDYKFYNTYTVTQNRYDDLITLRPTALYNPSYSWEVTKKLEAAIELGFLHDRISLEINFYQNRSSDQLVNYQLPSITGFNQVLSNFPATVQNSGWEGILNIRVFQKNSFSWSTSVNITSNRNKLVKFPGLESSSYANTYEVGKSLSVQRLYTYKGVNPQTGQHEILDVDNNGNLDDSDKRFMTPTDPRYFGGLNNTVTYKSFELSFLFQFARLKKQSYYYGMPGSSGNKPQRVLDRWQNAGDITKIAQLTQNYTKEPFYYYELGQSDFAYEDASFIRVKTLSLSYLIPEIIINRAKLQQARVFFQGQNLFTKTKYLGLDPETGTGLPPLMMMTFGVQLKF